MATSPVIPYIDPSVHHVGISNLRKLNAENLREIDETWVIQDNDTPLAVLLRYDKFLALQDERLSVLKSLMSEEEVRAFASGLGDLQHGRTKTISEIRASLRTKTQ